MRKMNLHCLTAFSISCLIRFAWESYLDSRKSCPPLNIMTLYLLLWHQTGAWCFLKNADDNKWSKAVPHVAVSVAEMGLSMLTTLTSFIRLSLWSWSRKWGAGLWLFALIPTDICFLSSLLSHSLYCFFSPPAFSPLLSFFILSFTLNLLVNTSRDVNEERWCWLLGRWPDKQNDLWCRDMGQFDAGKRNFIFFFIFLSKTHFYWCRPSCHIGV